MEIMKRNFCEWRLRITVYRYILDINYLPLKKITSQKFLIFLFINSCTEMILVLSPLYDFDYLSSDRNMTF